jgi:hypothetical protein
VIVKLNYKNNNRKMLLKASGNVIQLPEDKKLDLLRNLAESSPFTTAQDARSILPSIVTLLKKFIPRKKTGDEITFAYVECLLYTFHQLAHKVTACDFLELVGCLSFGYD